MKKEQLKIFMEYLQGQFPGCIDDHFTYNLIVNLIDYAYRTHGHSKGAARNIIYSVLPEVDIEKLEEYLPDFDEWEPEIDVRWKDENIM